MGLNPIDRMFDWNNDGKLSLLEHALKHSWYQMVYEDIEEDERKSRDCDTEIDYEEMRANLFLWRDEYTDNFWGIDPEVYFLEEEYLAAEREAERQQRRWIRELSSEERSMAERYGICPETYPKRNGFRRALERQVYCELENLNVAEEKGVPSILGNIDKRIQQGEGHMKISAGKKKSFLQETFELLKEGYISNSEAIRDIIGKMAKLDCDCAIEMWKYLIGKYPEVLHGFYDFGYIIMNTLEQAIDRETVYRLVVEDSFLKNAIFSELGDMQYSPIQAIRFYVFSGQTEIANELLALSYNNKYRRTSFFEILDGILNNYYNERLEDDAFEMLMEWIGKVDGKQERAKLNLAMLNYMEEE